MGGGNYVLPDQDELDEVAPGRSRSIDIQMFVKLDDIDPHLLQQNLHPGAAGEERSRTRCCGTRWCSPIRRRPPASSCVARSVWQWSAQERLPRSRYGAVTLASLAGWPMPAGEMIEGY